MEIWIAIIGAIVSIIIAIIGAIINYINTIKCHNRELKEKHYLEYIIAISNLAGNKHDKKYLNEYALKRNIMIMLASKNTLENMLRFDSALIDGNETEELFNTLIISIRKDLSLKTKKTLKIILIKSEK